jgi:hypothetical protein
MAALVRVFGSRFEARYRVRRRDARSAEHRLASDAGCVRLRASDRRPNWELLPLLYGVVVASAALVTLGAGVVLSFVSLPSCLLHLRWPGVSRTSVVFWLGVAINGLLFVTAVLLVSDL